MKRNKWSANRFISILLLFIAMLATISIRGVSAGAVMTKEMYQHAPESELSAPTNQVIVKYKNHAVVNGDLAPAGQERLQLLQSIAGIDLHYLRPLSGNAHVLQLPERLPLETVERIASQIRTLADVEYAEPDYIMLPAFEPNDPQYGAQWHYFEGYGINLPAAWDFGAGSGNVRIAVLDTGITDHADLLGRWTGGYDFIANIATANDGNGRDNDPHDPGNWVTFQESQSGPFAGCSVTNSTWHGTHVAGTIGAAGNNNVGVVGVNWVSQLVPIRVLGKCGGFTSDVADGMRWAAGLTVTGVPTNVHPARVLNLSLAGIGACSSTYQNAIDAVNAAGAIVVVAAGNHGVNLNTTTIQPANCNGVVTVAATDRGGDKAISSNYGATIEISAPGGETAPTLQNGVLSTLNTGITSPDADTYGFYSGTSMAVPHVSGVISLMLSLDPNLSAAQVLQILQSSASAFPPGSGCTTATCGSGILNAGEALDALGIPPPTSTPSLTPTYTPTVATATPSQTPSNTSTASLTPSRTPSPSQTPSNTATFTASATATLTPSRTPTATASLTPSNTATFTPSRTSTATASLTPSRTPTATASLTPSNTATFTPSRTSTATASPTPSNTATFAPSNTPTATFTPSRTPTATASLTPSNTATFTPTRTVTASLTPSNTATFTPSRTPTATPSNTPSRTPTASLTPSNTSTANLTPSRTPTASFTPSGTLTSSVTPSRTSTASMTPSRTFTPSRTLAVTASITPSRTVTATLPPANTSQPTRHPLPTNPALISRVITPFSLTVQYGLTSGSLASLRAIEQSGVEDDPSTYVEFQTPGTVFMGFMSFQLPADAQPSNVHLALLQVNIKGPSFQNQVWTWAIYDWRTQDWIKVDDNIGARTGEWNIMIFRIPNVARYISPSGEMRIRLESNNASGDLKIDYEALHITYRSVRPTPTHVVATTIPRRPPYQFPTTYTRTISPTATLP